MVLIVRVDDILTITTLTTGSVAPAESLRMHPGARRGRLRRSILLAGAAIALPRGLALAAGAPTVTGGSPASSAQPSATSTCPALLQHSFARLQDEASVSLCSFAGKVILAVNTASLCGYTSQYEGLEKLHARFERRGLVILGFPSNDFGQQEPGNSAQIGEVCFNTYGVRFPMFTKSAVIGSAANPFYAQLARATGEVPRWNFHKYLIDRSGKPVASYPSRVAPESRELVAAIERALAAA